MTSLQLTLSVPGTAPAVLTLPQPLTPHVLHALAQAVTGALGVLRRDLSRGAPDAQAAEPAARRPDASEIEYASWMPDAGAMEYASWTAQLLMSRR